MSPLKRECRIKLIAYARSESFIPSKHGAYLWNLSCVAASLRYISFTELFNIRQWLDILLSGTDPGEFNLKLGMTFADFRLHQIERADRRKRRALKAGLRAQRSRRKKEKRNEQNV